jgi:hypothetical protein
MLSGVGNTNSREENNLYLSLLIISTILRRYLGRGPQLFLRSSYWAPLIIFQQLVQAAFISYTERRKTTKEIIHGGRAVFKRGSEGLWGETNRRQQKSMGLSQFIPSMPHAILSAHHVGSLVHLLLLLIIVCII